MKKNYEITPMSDSFYDSYYNYDYRWLECSHCKELFDSDNKFFECGLDKNLIFCTMSCRREWILENAHDYIEEKL
jgi:hypothetical protein